MSSSSKDTVYLLNCSENYKKTIECDVNDITQKYTHLALEYVKLFLEKITKNPHTDRVARFILIRGLDTITNVFLYLLYYTKNINLTFFHCQKAFYYYVEFVEQIADEEKSYLQLTSREAITYVYKTNIYEINGELKKANSVASKECKEKIKYVETYIRIIQTYLFKIIHAQLPKPNMLILLDTLSVITEKLNRKYMDHLETVENVVDKLYYQIEDVHVFFEINMHLITKYVKTPKSIINVENKLQSNNQEEIQSSLLELPEQCVRWLTCRQN